jgi:hypothetical protein
MNTTRIFLSYSSLVISLLSLAFFVYFKFIVVKSSPNSRNRDKIIGDMHNPEKWRDSNNKMAYLLLFWAILSGAIFIYLKFFSSAEVISLLFLFIYIAAIIISAFLFGRSRKDKAY